MRYLILLSIIVLVSGCSIFQSHADYILKHRSEICANNICSQPIDTETFTSSHDTVYTTVETENIGIDSMTLSLYMYCDSNNQVLIKNSELLNSKYGKLLFQLNHGKLTIQSLRDSLKLQHKTVHVIKRITTTVTTKVPVYVYKDHEVTPWYVWLLLGASGIANVWLVFKKGF